MATQDVAPNYEEPCPPAASDRAQPAPEVGVACAQRMRPVTCAWLLGLIAWTTLLSFYGIGGGAGLEPVDCWVAQTAREMYENTTAQGWRGLTTPYFSEEPFLHKSPGPYWAVCLTAFLRDEGVHLQSARVPGAVSAILLVLTVFWLARRIAGDRAALFAGYAAAASVGLLYWSHRPSADLGVSTLMTMSLACLWVASEAEPPGRKRVMLWLLGYFFAGLAMVYKMPMPVVCVGLPVFLYVLLRNRWRIFASPWHLVGLVLFLLPWLPWALWIISEFPIAVEKWRTEFWDRATGDLPNVAAQFNWYFYLMYFGVALLLAFPFSLSVPQAVVRAFRPTPGVNRNGQWFLLIWFLSLLLFFTVSIGKETRYFWPAMPPLFVLLGIELAIFFDPGRQHAPRLERIGFWSVVVGVTVGLVGGLFALRNFWEKTFPEGEYAWHEVLVPALVAAVIFAAGSILAAGLFRRRRTNESFGVLVATMWLTWLWVWPTLMPKLGSQMPFIDFAQQLVTLTPEQRSCLRQVAHHDPRITWYSNVRYPRLIDQLDMLRMEGGKRNLQWEEQYYGEKMVEALAGEDPLLLVSSPNHYSKFLADAPLPLAQKGAAMPKSHVWFQARVGRFDRRYILFGNQPPPWPEPTVRLSENQMTRIREASKRAAALLDGTTGDSGESTAR